MQDQALSEDNVSIPCEDGANGRGRRGSLRDERARRREPCSSQRAGMVVAELEGIGPSARGRLAEAIDEAMERELSSRGAAAPGITSGSDRDATLSDQLFRARRVGAKGIAIVLGPLRAATGALAALEPEDCATLRFLATATRERPLALVLDSRDSATGGYGDPVSLVQLLAPSSTPVRVDRTLAAAVETLPAPPPPPAVILSEAKDPHSSRGVLRPAASGRQQGGRDSRPPHRRRLARDARRSLAHVDAAARGRPRAPAPRDPGEALHRELHAAGERPRRRARRSARAARPRRVRRDASRRATARRSPPSLPRRSGRGWCSTPTTSPRASPACTARGPRASCSSTRCAWDVARMVEERLMAMLGARASLTDELLLWSALPTVDAPPARDPRARHRGPARPGPARGGPRAPARPHAEYVRRMRVGPREIHKLDVIESRVRTTARPDRRAAPRGRRRGGGGHRSPRRDASRRARCCSSRATTGSPSTAVAPSGRVASSPEEVLVGAFAMLIGDVH